MKSFLSAFFFFFFLQGLHAQSVAKIKRELEKNDNPIAYLKNTAKKKFKIDTIAVVTTANFIGIADSIAYTGKIGKVYGPFKKANCLIKVLSKSPNTFYHVSHILIDTSVFRKKFADSLAGSIIRRIENGESSFASMARTYSADTRSAVKGGDIGWFVRGIMLPQLDQAISRHKQGDLFKVWTAAGLHIVRIDDNPRQDDGFALFLRVFL